MSPTVMQSWKLDCMVIGLAWLEGFGLAIVQEQGTRTLVYLYNQQGEPTSDQFWPQCAASEALDTALQCNAK